LSTWGFGNHGFRHLERTLLGSEALFSLLPKSGCPQLLDDLAQTLHQFTSARAFVGNHAATLEQNTSGMHIGPIRICVVKAFWSAK
jgi:hypothetical protein